MSVACDDGAEIYRPGAGSTVGVGSYAEQVAAEYLVRQGYEVLERNYRRKHCEIDVVARRNDTVYFVEVKYRATNYCGTGFDYIAGAKLQHMARAAQTWVRERRWSGEYTLAAIEVSGVDYEVLDFIDTIY